jgi:hypothetical protein
MNHLITAAVISLNVAVLLGAVDGLYFHLWKYKLYGRSETRYEHKLHTIRAFLFIPIVWLLFGKNYGGWLLWAGVLMAAADTIVELLDVFCEMKSRAGIGGLSTGEYAIHLNATGLRFVALTLILLAKPASAWELNAPWEIAPEYPSWVTWLALNSIPGGLLGGLLHVWLMRARYRVRI